MKIKIKELVAVIFILLCVSVLLGFIGTPLYLLGRNVTTESIPEPNTPFVDIEVEPPSIVDIIPEIRPGVVHLQAPVWQGSGFVVGPNLITTARHCVEGIEDFEITTDGKHKLHAIRALSSNNHDIGFIYVDDLTCIAENCEKDGVLLGKHKVQLTVLKLGSITGCQLGEIVIVIGSPHGKRHFNATVCGILSMATMQVEKFGTDEGTGWSVLFMSDAPTWGGSSGSPVFTLDGTVVGVLVGGYGREENISYCVPVDVISDDLDIVAALFKQDEYHFEKENDYAPEAWEY